MRNNADARGRIQSRTEGVIRATLRGLGRAAYMAFQLNENRHRISVRIGASTVLTLAKAQALLTVQSTTGTLYRAAGQ